MPRFSTAINYKALPSCLLALSLWHLAPVPWTRQPPPDTYHYFALVLAFGFLELKKNANNIVLKITTILQWPREEAAPCPFYLEYLDPSLTQHWWDCWVALEATYLPLSALPLQEKEVHVIHSLTFLGRRRWLHQISGQLQHWCFDEVMKHGGNH